MKSFSWLLIKVVQPMNVNWHLWINFKIYFSCPFVHRDKVNDHIANAFARSVRLIIRIRFELFESFLVVSGTNIGSFRWNDKNAMLAGIVDGKVNIWLYPNVVFIEPNLLEKTTYRIESG